MPCPSRLSLFELPRKLPVTLALGLGGTAAGNAQSSWQWQFTPFVLAPAVEGTTELGLSAGDVSIDAGDVFDQLRVGGMLQFEGHHASSFSFRLRYAVLDADSNGASAGGPLPVHYDQTVSDAVVGYRFGRGRDQFEIFGGLRHWGCGCHCGSFHWQPAARRRLDRSDCRPALAAPPVARVLGPGGGRCRAGRRLRGELVGHGRAGL